MFAATGLLIRLFTGMSPVWCGLAAVLPSFTWLFAIVLDSNDLSVSPLLVMSAAMIAAGAVGASAGVLLGRVEKARMPGT
jgi:hypothetical protein